MVGEVDGRDLDLFVGDVLPDVELGPVGEGEDPDVLAPAVAAVVEVPQFGALGLGVPLPELVAEAEDPLLRPGLLLVPAPAAEDGVEAALPDAPEQRRGLQAVAGSAGAHLLDHPSGVDVVLDGGDHQPGAELDGSPVPELEDLGEVAAGVDVHHREGQGGRGEGLGRQVGHDDRVLAPREEQDRALELGGHLADDVDRLGLQGGQMAERVAVVADARPAPHGLARGALAGTARSSAGPFTARPPSVPTLLPARNGSAGLRRRATRLGVPTPAASSPCDPLTRECRRGQAPWRSSHPGPWTREGGTPPIHWSSEPPAEGGRRRRRSPARPGEVGHSSEVRHVPTLPTPPDDR